MIEELNGCFNEKLKVSVPESAQFKARREEACDSKYIRNERCDSVLTVTPPVPTVYLFVRRC